MKTYQKHVIECQCILPILKEKKKKVYHKFAVTSILEDDKVIEKYAICNNCGILHRVYEIGKSDIMWGKEDMKSLVTTEDDVRFNLESLGHDKLVNILTKFKVDLSDWEIADFLLENSMFGNIILEREEIEENLVYKYLEIDNNTFKIKKDIQQRFF